MEIADILKSRDPFQSFRAWLDEACAANIPEPTAMTLATASKEGRPSARIVLYKGTSKCADGTKGFRIFTNYQSRKSRELAENSWAALVFFWPQLNRQIRIEGKIEKLPDQESDDYFQSRARGSRIGAWASPQSRKIKDRDELLKLVAEIEKRFLGAEVPRPDNWGGWLLQPAKIEFWQAGEFRLHDRVVFEREADGKWQVSRLAP
jgi:pyridoxamine 5'-phosphate oxidase